MYTSTVDGARAGCPICMHCLEVLLDPCLPSSGCDASLEIAPCLPETFRQVSFFFLGGGAYPALSSKGLPA